MTQEEKSILLQDLCARLPYGVVADCVGEYVKIKYVDPYSGMLYISRYTRTAWEIVECIKPYLRPMSSMTEEEIHDTIGFPRKISIGTLKGWVDYTISNPDFVDWLNAHHFDYRGLIEKGLALKAPEGMYEY